MSQIKSNNKLLGDGANSSEAIALRERVNGLTKNIATEAQRIINVVMPEKIVTLNDVLKNTPEYNLKDMEKLKQMNFNTALLNDLKPPDAQTPTSTSTPTPKTKKRKVDYSNTTETNNDFPHKIVYEKFVPSNETIVKFLGDIKREVLELVEMINIVKIWIQLLVPKIEDGNNFGVGIQEEIISELGRAEESGYTNLEAIANYYLRRAKLVSKVLKYPGVEDYKQAIVELDLKEFINLRLCILDLRNLYLTLYDMIWKNQQKITMPRGTNDHLLHVI